MSGEDYHHRTDDCWFSRKKKLWGSDYWIISKFLAVPKLDGVAWLYMAYTYTCRCMHM